MQNKQIKQLIEDVLKVDARLWDEDGELDSILLLHLLDKTDTNVITLLLTVEELRDRFFIKISDVYVFKSNEFRFFIEENRIDNSYTSYKNKIGLALRDKFLSNNDEVVLNFPYKDCVLEGGQSREDMVDLAFRYSADSCEYEEVKDKKGTKEKSQRREVFFNQIIGADEIDRLFDEKAFTNFVRYHQDGADTPHEFNRNADGVITDNLIIKGNNLLALHSIKRQFAGRVKLIYIDPPYNTGNDGFKYNDNFNHSTWLTFMKNRLEIAKELLRDDGVIFVQIDDNEQAYLKVLMDEIFGREQVDCIVWQKMDARYDKNTNAKVINRYKEIHEYILIGYKKDKKEYLFNKIKKLPDWKNEQSNPDNDKRGKYKQGIISFLEGHKNEDKNSEFYYSITLPSGRVMTRHFFITKEEFERLRADNRIYFPNNGDGVPAKKIFEDEEQEYKMDSILRGFGTTSTMVGDFF
jgi:adenine-specific DNA-methyltransferase